MELSCQPDAQAVLLPGEKDPSTHWMDGLHSRSGRCGVENIFLPLPGIKLRPSNPQSVAVLTELAAVDTDIKRDLFSSVPTHHLFLKAENKCNYCLFSFVFFKSQNVSYNTRRI
jgi:hypothetical protein